MILVSNTDEIYSEIYNVSLGTDTRDRLGQNFTTGSAPGGYRVHEITFRVSTTTNADQIQYRASIREALDSGAPSGTDLIILERSGSLSADTHNVFTAPADSAPLRPNTKYTMLIKCINSSCGSQHNLRRAHFVYSTTGDEYTGPTGSWRLADRGSYQTPDDRVWRQLASPLVVSLKGEFALLPVIEEDGITIVSTPTAKPDTYAAGDLIEIEVVFDQAVEVKAGTTPGFQFGVGYGNARRVRTAQYASGSGTDTLRFQYEVQENDPVDTDGIWIGNGSDTWTNAEGNIASTSGNALLTHALLGPQSNHKVDPRINRPMITDLEFVSDPLFAVVGYGRGERIKIGVTFNLPVVVTGTPAIAVRFGGKTREATYDSSESTSTQLVFGYTVTGTDQARNGISLPENALARNADPYQGLLGTGTIRRDNPGQPHASLRNDATDRDHDHRVQGDLYPLGNAGLRELTVDDATLDPAFTSANRSYRAEVDKDTDIATIRAAANIPGATVEIAPADADGQTDGHQTGLEHGENTVTVQVRSVDTATTGEYSLVIVRAPGIPDTPAKPTVTALSPTSLHVEWETPNGNGSPITSYLIRYRPAGEAAWLFTNAPNRAATEANIVDLSPGILYEVQVRATNSAGHNGDWSESGTRDVSVPDAPERPVVTVESPTSLLVDWTEPSNNGLLITGYKVRYRDHGAPSWTDHVHDGTGTETTLSNLTAGGSYQVQVRGVNAEGNGPWSQPGTRDASPPDAPEIPILTVLNNAHIQVTWTTPTDNGSPITSYDVRYQEPGDATWTSQTSGSLSGDVIGPLAMDTIYHVQVKATSTEGSSDWSPSATGTIKVPDQMNKPTLTVVTATKLKVEWVPPADNGAPLTGYTVRYWEQGTSGFTDIRKADTSTERTIDHLSTTKTYEVQVRAESLAGRGPWSAVAEKALRVPPRPAAPTLTVASATSLQARWTEPQDENATITGYDVRYRRDDSVHWLAWPHRSGDTGTTITDLVEDREYEVQIRAINAVGNSAWSPSDTERPAPILANNGDLRLVNDLGPSDDGQGRLEVFYRRQWGTVCDDRFTRPFLDHSVPPADPENPKVPNIAPQLACQLMGHATGEVVARSTLGMSLAHDTQKIWLDDVRCAEGSNHWTGSPPTGLQHCYHAGWALHNCAADHSEDVHLQCTGELSEPATETQEEPEEPDPLTAQIEDVPATHDGTNPFTFRLVLNDEIDNAEADVRDDTFAVSGGTVTDATRVNGRGDRWEITITPDGTGNITIELAANRACGNAGAPCTADGRMLTTTALALVGGPPATPQPTQGAPQSLTARFASMPAEHNGTNAFRFQLVFSEEIFDGSETLNKNRAVADALTVTGGSVKGSQRINKTSFDAYWIKVRPDGRDAVTITLAPPATCTDASPTCTPDERPLSNTISATVPGPPSLSIADAAADEGPNAVLDFVITLSRAASGIVAVDYATVDGTAHAGADYTATSGTAVFAPGDTRTTISVAVLDDSHNEGEETMSMRLSDATGAYISDGEATGTIRNTDHLPAAWLSRFGRTVAEQVVDAARSRLASAPVPGANLTIAGLALTPGGNLDVLEPDESSSGERNITGRDLLTGSSFSLATGTANGGTAGLWGRGALSRFSGTEADLSLDGDVTSLLLGADWAQERSTLGAMVSHTRATGSYQGADAGRVESDLTGLYPYGQHALTSRLSVWGVAGYGVGTLALTPDGQPSLKTDIDLAMAAAGVRSVLLEATAEGGPELAAVTDVMGVQTNSDAVRDNEAGNLAAAKTEVSRVRLGVEGAWTGLKLGHADLKPSLELGVRRDGGDAETGLGVDVGAGIAWSNQNSGFSASLHARGLLTHESDGFRDQGLSASLGWDPRPTSDRGLSLRLTQTAGAPATGGMHSLLSRTTLEGLALEDRSANPHSVELGLGYGVPAFDGLFTATPELGLRLSDRERRYRLGWKLGLAARDQRSMELRLDLTRTERPGTELTGHGVGITLTSRW